MKQSTYDPKAELWKRVHAALDRRQLASANEQVLDLLLEHPELALLMDEVLLLEDELEALTTSARITTQRPQLRLSIRRARAASIAAALLLICTPLVFGPAKPGVPTTTNSGTEFIADAADAAPAFPESPKAAATRPMATIHSFELTVASKATRAPAHISTSTFSASPRPAIRTLTSSRTRTAPRSTTFH